MPWGNIAAGILPMDLRSCKVLIQHRSKEVRGNGEWSIIGGAINEVDIFKPIVNKRESQYDLGENFLPIDYAIKKDLNDDFRQFVEYSLKTELCEEGGYGCNGSGEELSDLNVFYQFGMFKNENKDGKVTENTNKNDMIFTYLNHVGFVDRQFNPPPSWESLSSAWVDVEDLLKVANDEVELEDILPPNIDPYFNGYYRDDKYELRDAQDYGDIEKYSNGYMIRYDNDSVELLREFKMALQDPESRSILLGMKKKCMTGNIG